MSNLWYHIVPKDADMSKGIISPYWMADHNLTQLAIDSTYKYRYRLTTSWGIYPKRNPNSLTLEEVLLGLNLFRGENGTRAIYMFKYPPSFRMGPNMEKVLKHKDVYEIDLDKVNDIIEIEYDINNGPPKSWYDKVKPAEYFSTYDDDAEKHGKLLFAGIPHISVITKQGRIPPTAIRKLTYFPLFHGTNKKYPILKTHVSGAYPDDKVVYGSPSYEFALSYAGNKWEDLTLNQTMVDDQQVLTEIIPGAFDKIYNTKGYVYHMSSDGFYQFKETGREWVCIWDVKPYKIETIPNVLKALEKTSTKLYRYPNLPPFIKDRKKYIYNLCKQWNVDPTNYFKAIEG